MTVWRKRNACWITKATNTHSEYVILNSHMPCRVPAILRQCRVLRETPRGSRKKPNAGMSPTCRLWTADIHSHMPRHVHAALCRGLEQSLSERQGRGMACLNQTRPHCVNQMGKTQSKPLAALHGKGTAWARHGMCELALTVRRKNFTPPPHSHYKNPTRDSIHVFRT
jgi:hypothetical protein